MRGARFCSARSLLIAGWVAGGLAGPSAASSADSEEGSRDLDLVRLHNTGFRLSIAPTVVIPTGGGSAGFALSLGGRYGIDVGSVIVAPGGRVGGYFLNPNIYLGMGTVRLTVPLGAFGPFVEGGAGVGYVNQESKSGVALLAGAGFMLYLGNQFGFGLAAGYEKITGTNFSVIGIGPSIMFAF